MAKWKCEICGNEFENFHAQGFDNKIYCPLCYFKKENKELKKQLEELKEEKQEWINLLAMFKNQQKEFINYLEDLIKFYKNRDSYMVADILGSYDLNNIELELLEEILQKYKSIIGDDK